MGKGIAVEFKKRYGGIAQLKKQVAAGAFIIYTVLRAILNNKMSFVISLSNYRQKNWFCLRFEKGTPRLLPYHKENLAEQTHI